MRESVPRKPSVLQRARQRLRFALERLVLRGLRYRLMLAAAILAVVALVAGVLILLLDTSFSNLGEAMWWAFLRLSDPGHLGDDEGMARRSVSMVVTVLGFLLFLGLLIALLTHWLDDTISKLESGLTPVPFSDHVVILGWTYCTPAIVTELLQSRDRAQRFLAGCGVRQLRIVILAPHVDESVVRTVRERLGKLWNDRQVSLRAGTPLQVDHLERVAFRDAAVMILPTTDHADSNPEAVDAQTVKTLRSVSRIANESGSVPPLAVAELYDGRKAAVARRAYAGPTEIIASDDIISRFITQSVRHNGLFDVFSELLALDEGNALYVRHVEGQTGARFGSLSCPRAVLLGTVRSGELRATLNPHPETVLDAKDLLVFMARHFDDCVPHVAERAGSPMEAMPPPRPVPERRRLLILGWNRKVPVLLDEFRQYGTDVFEIDVVSATPSDEREKTIERHGFSASNSHVRQIEADFTVPGVLERLEPQNYDNIILLASERFAEEDQADANTVFTYLMLRGILPEEAPHPELLVELLDEQNQSLFSREKEDVIVSPRLVSHVLSQVSLRRELAVVIQELSQPRGAQIVLRPAQEYLVTNEPVRFEDLESAAAARGEIALGLRRSQGIERGVVLNPDRNAEWSLTPGDEVVVLVSYTEPDGGE